MNIRPAFIPFRGRGPLGAEMRIIEYMGRSAPSKSTKIRIAKISSKGLTFWSELRFPVNRQLILRFHIDLFGSVLELNGYIVWSMRVRDTNEYEAVFTIGEQTRQSLIRLLKALALEYLPAYMRAEYHYHQMAESSYDFLNHRINLLY